MREFKGTPGPWEIQRGRFSLRQNEFSIVRPNAGREISASIANWIMNEHDARLLAAAPELLEQLQSLVAILEEGFHRSVTEEARAAINKALGITEPSPCSPQ